MPETSSPIKTEGVSREVSSDSKSDAPVAATNTTIPETEASRRTPRSGVITELKQLQQDVKSFKTGDLVVPILSLVFLALLTTFVYIPMISTAIDFRNERTKISQDIEKLNRVNDEIAKIDVGLLQQDLSVSRQVIPFSLQVSSFVLYINNLADDKGLDFKEIAAGDIQIREKGAARETDPVTKGVSGPLKYTGPLTSILNFLDDLQNASPYVVSSDNIEMKQMTDSNEWEISLLITGYYLNQAALPKPDIYQPFSGYSQFQNVIDVFRNKAEVFESDSL